LRAIEADEHEALPALPYAQGFVRSFARAVAIDSEAMAARFKAETTKQPHVPSVSTLEPLDERRLPSAGLVVGTVLALFLVLAAVSAWGSGAFDSPIADPALQVAKVEPAPDPAPNPASGPRQAPASASASASAPAPAPAPAAAVPTSGQVVLEATEDVWVRIYDPATKTVAMSGVLTPGQRFEVPAEPAGLMLWTGKAGALRVTIGGALIPPLGSPVQTLRAVSLAPTDLRARGAAGVAPLVRPADGTVSGVE
jgi:cytoskeletal protein RodZ